MTSNIGSHHLLDGIDDDGNITESARRAVLGDLRQQFRPEFLNRIDDTILFRPLKMEEIEQIVDLLCNELRERLHDRNITLELSTAARSFIAMNGFDPVYGARPLKRFLQQELETRIGRAIVADMLHDGAQLRVDLGADGLVLRIDNPVRAPQTDHETPVEASETS
jgi:ATP-dependent Clp protease ATP-binding subunit ClpB